MLYGFRRPAFADLLLLPGGRPRPPDAADGTWRVMQEDIDRVQEFRKCIECFLCQDVCHVLRDHGRLLSILRPRARSG